MARAGTRAIVVYGCRGPAKQGLEGGVKYGVVPPGGCTDHNRSGFPDPHRKDFCNRNQANRVRFVHLGSLEYLCLLGFDRVLRAAQT